MQTKELQPENFSGINQPIRPSFLDASKGKKTTSVCLNHHLVVGQDYPKKKFDAQSSRPQNEHQIAK